MSKNKKNIQNSDNKINILKDKLNIKENKKLFSFVMIFSVLIISFYTLSSFGYLSWANNLLANWGVQVSSLILIKIFPNIIIEQNSILIEHFKVNVSAGCDGLEVIVLFLIAIISFPVTIKKKYLIMIIGSLFLFFLNIIRIIALFYIGFKYNEHLDLFHHDIFPAFFIIIEFVIWYYWINWATKKEAV